MRKLVLFFVLFSLGSYCYAQDNAALNNVSKTIISQEQEALIFSNAKNLPEGTQLSLAIIENGNVFFYGVKKKHDTLKRTDNNQKIFEIGSITKVFTATLLSKFVVNNIVALDDNINDYLPFELRNNTVITFKQLANHTSGLPRLPSNFTPANPENPYQDYTKKKLLDYLTEELVINSTPGSTYNYSNLGFGLLGYTLSEIAVSNYQELLAANIFSKYGMSNSYTSRSQVKNKLITGLDGLGRPVSNWDLDVLAGAGAILSSVDDLSRFLIAHFDDSNVELKLTLEPTFTINHISSIGLGWEIITRKSGAIWYKHNGGTGGYSSSMALNTTKKKGIIILSNVSGLSSKSDNIDNLCFDLMKTIE